MRRRPALCATIAAAMSLLALCASALPAAAFSKRVETACKGDYQNLCPQYKPTSPQLRACMESKANEISPRCIDALLASGEVDRKRVKR